MSQSAHAKQPLNTYTLKYILIPLIQKSDKQLTNFAVEKQLHFDLNHNPKVKKKIIAACEMFKCKNRLCRALQARMIYIHEVHRALTRLPMILDAMLTICCSFLHDPGIGGFLNKRQSKLINHKALI